MRPPDPVLFARPDQPIRYYPRSGAVPSPGKILKHDGGRDVKVTLEYYRDGLKHFASAVPYGPNESGPFWTLTTDAD